MRFLKQLDLHGFKTFASPTAFVFDRGVTAIVGPNGSGKSNLADALRWVLGEQSYTTLRAKRTEDMIFSGSEQRSRLGMASVSLVFDNSSGWLPTEFSEVEIGRRAYRSGENEYYVNGNRVRLRDIVELLGSSGLSERNYTVIGQGLVDQALSQRPEERRRLFEEAAGITVYQAKRDQALHQLADAQANLTRAQDIIAELTPRVRYLKGQARRAEEYQQVKSQLEERLATWYGCRWYLALEALKAAQERLAAAVAESEEQARALAGLLQETAARRAERGELRERLSDWHRSSSQLHRQAEVVQRELAVRTEQTRLLGEQRAELQREIGRTQAALEDGSERIAAAQAELAEATAAHETLLARVAAATSDLEAHEQARRSVARRLSQAQEQLLALRSQLADQRARLGQVGERRSELLRSQIELARAIETAQAQIADLEARSAEIGEQSMAAAALLAGLEQKRQSQAQALAAAQEAERAAREQLSGAQRAMARLQDQHDLLTRLRDEGAGLNAGPRSVIAARNELPGIVGTLGDLIEVPPELDRAIEAALGGRLQDVVVRRWEDADAAVSFLKETRRGRATFLPLDSLRPGRAADVPRQPGVLGLASSLVKYQPALRPAVELALNRTLVVEDLPTARRVLERDGHATLVTLEGEIVRPGGSVTGGREAERRESGVLARARTLRELPGQIQQAREQVAQCESAVAAARQAQQAAQAAIGELLNQQKECSAGRERLANEKNRLHLAIDRARQSEAWQRDRRQQAERELTGLAGREQELQGAIDGLARQILAQEAAVAALQQELAAAAPDELVANLARLRAEAESSSQQRLSYQARVRDLEALQAQRGKELAARQQRMQALEQQQAEAGRVTEEQGEVARELADRIAVFALQIDPAEARLAEIEQGQRSDEAAERDLRELVRVAQMRQSQAELAWQRTRDSLAHLRREMEKDLGLASVEGDEADGIQPPLPLNGLVAHLQPLTAIPEHLEREVRDLRAQLSRLGPVNPEAPAEYAEVEARHAFLSGQAADLEKAVSALQGVIAELDQVMQREFVSTFKAVAGQFREEFKHLFGGGAARLFLTDPDSPATTGIEINARPPGKREQGLPLLSGGERALTAAALMFSILKVRPTPFCVLDEVDAALDEANVGRFREALRELSSQTQFILITHNRGTIEAADTIYGISMGADNTSQVLSLKLNGHQVVQPATEEAAAL